MIRNSGTAAGLGQISGESWPGDVRIGIRKAPYPGEEALHHRETAWHTTARQPSAQKRNT